MTKSSSALSPGTIFQLIKFKLSLAVTVSAATGFFISRQEPGIRLLFVSLGVFLLASGAAVLNQITEINYDRLMKRTMGRPLPLEKISVRSAWIITALLFFSGLIFLSFTHINAVLLGVLAVILYNVVYTRLKRVTSLAIVPGALVGAIPPLMGFEATHGTVPGADIILFSSFIFLWQLPHFWLILIRNRDDYKAAGFVTISDVFRQKQVRLLVLLWVVLSSAILIAVSLYYPVFSGWLNRLLVPLNIVFIILFCLFLFRQEEEQEYYGAFILMNIYNLLIMIFFVINSLL
jgi:heme o synthase